MTGREDSQDLGALRAHCFMIAITYQYIHQQMQVTKLIHNNYQNYCMLAPG